MLKKISKYFLKRKKKYNWNFFKTNKKIKKYKKKKKGTFSKKKKKLERNKNTLQLKIDFKGRNLKKLIFILSILLLILIVLVIKWPFFKVKNINIIRLDENINLRLIERKIDEYKWKILFNVNKDEIKNLITETEQNIKDIDIVKIPPSTINIRLSSYEIIFKTNFNSNNYLITQNWVFVPKNVTSNDISKITIKDTDIQNYPNYRKVLESENLKTIKYLENKLKDNIVNLKIEDIIYYKISKEVHFIINNKTRIIFDLEETDFWNSDEKLKQIFVFSKEKIDITKPWIIYIDNRVESKIFYCPETEIKTCINNINYIYDEKIDSSYYTKKVLENN